MKFMTNAQDYGIIEVKSDFPVRRLLRVPHRETPLIAGFPAFGPGYFSSNAAEMKKNYSHPVTGERISFREPTTSESISLAAYKFSEMAKSDIFDPRWLQIGRIVRTSEGVYTNPSKEALNCSEVDEGKLKKLIERAKKIKVGKGHVYLGDNDFGFADYDSFTTGVQDADIFTNGGLAFILEHARDPKNLRIIASPKNYPRGVNVWSFDKVDSPILKVAGLDSDRDSDGGRLGVFGGSWVGSGSGYAFGVLDAGEASTAQKI